MGAPGLEDTIAGLRLQLPPIKQLWNSVHGAETLCRVMEKLLAPSKKMTVLEICCGNGLVGLYLSKVRMRYQAYVCNACSF
jgi:tRNA/tmRNA/rRNA uracil-C5-methylase (TrmA/RlmC/RlmD family)